MKARIFFLACLLPACALAEPWSLVDCGPEGTRGWSQFEHAVRSAAPGSTLYVPQPYPKADRDVIADYLYQYKDMMGRARLDRLPTDETRLMTAIESQTVRFTVLRIENWTTLRCGTEKKRDFYFLVRVFDSVSGAELSRAVLNDSGLLSVMENLKDASRGQGKAVRAKVVLPDPPESLGEISSRFKINGDSPQYVMAFGTVQCGFTRPCLAFRHGADAYLYSRLSDELFLISSQARRLKQGKEVGSLETNARLQSALAQDERFVSLGGDTWAVVKKVPAPQ